MFSDITQTDITPLDAKSKAKKIIDYCKKHSVTKYIETGVYRGETVSYIFEAKSLKIINVTDIYGMELGKDLANKLIKKYERYANVHIYEGDTVKILPTILENINDRALFWLDAHYSGHDTARGNVDCPLLKELEIIKKHNINNHVILIDDARTFHDKDNKSWPSLRRVYNGVKRINDNYNIKIENDIIVCEP